jgi:hypothetical protein
MNRPLQHYCQQPSKTYNAWDLTHQKGQKNPKVLQRKEKI